MCPEGKLYVVSLISGDIRIGLGLFIITFNKLLIIAPPAKVIKNIHASFFERFLQTNQKITNPKLTIIKVEPKFVINTIIPVNTGDRQE